MKTVKITVEGGVVQHVEVPEGITVIVHDYDVEDIETDVLQHDDHGDEFIESIWTPERTSNADVRD